MNDSNVKSLLKVVSMALVLISVLMLFCGAMTVSDRDTRRDIKSDVKDALEDINDYKDDIDELQDELDEYDIDINAKKLFRQAKKILKVLKDAKISAGEVASCAPSFISLASEIEDNKAIARLVGGSDMRKIIETIGDAKTALIAFMILFYLTLIAGVVTIILHFIDSKLPGVVITVLNLIWLIVWGVAVHKINVYADEEMDVEKIVKVMGAPVWAFILAALALVIWMFKDTIAQLLSGGVSPVAMAGAAASAVSRPVRPAAPAIICPVCGNALNEGALFCPECGNRYEPPAPPAEVFCTNCGTKLSADTVFCPNCGTKQQ